MTTDTLNTVKDEALINDTRKSALLSTPVEHIDITKFDARPIVVAMGKMSFTSRDLARATGIYNQMLEDPACSVILVIGLLSSKFDIWFAVITFGALLLYIGFTVTVTEWRTHFRRAMNEQDSKANTKANASIG